MDDFEQQVISGLATITERQTNQHTEVINRLDTTNGRLREHDDAIDDLNAHKNRALGWIAGAGCLFAFGITVFEYFKHAK